MPNVAWTSLPPVYHIGYIVACITTLGPPSSNFAVFKESYCTMSLCRQSTFPFDWITLLFQSFVLCSVSERYLWQKCVKYQMCMTECLFQYIFKMQKISKISDSRCSVGPRHLWQIICMFMLFVLCLLWLSQPLGREKPLYFIVWG